MFKRTWLLISNQGISRDNDPETRRLRLTNQFVFLAVLFTLAYTVLCYAFGLYKTFYFEAVFTVVYLLLFFNNSAGRVKQSRFLFVCLVNLQMFGLCLCFGQRSQIHLIFIPVAAVPLILFGISSTWRIVLFSSITLSLFIFMFVAGFSSFRPDAINPAVYPYLEFSSIFTSILCELIVIYALMEMANRSEQRLDEDNVFLQHQLKAIFDNSRDALFLVDDATLKIIKANKRAAEIFGMDAEEEFYVMRGVDLHEHKMTKEEVAGMREELKATGVFEAEFLYKTKAGRTFWGAIALRLISIQDKTYQSVRVKDIHSQRTAQEITKAALHEKEVLLAEIHHRVKNNLAVISGLLGLQSGYVEDETAKKLFEESRNRIHTMALIHEKLYRHESLSEIEFGIYIHDLIAHIERSHNFIGTRIVFSVLCTDVYLDIKSAVPCGLILNELVTNACKHAFPGRSEGKILIECIKTDNKLLLQVSDNGVGFNAKEQVVKSKTLGLTLINGLVEQLNGQLTIKSEGGTRYSILFEV